MIVHCLDGIISHSMTENQQTLCCQVSFYPDDARLLGNNRHTQQCRQPPGAFSVSKHTVSWRLCLHNHVYERQSSRYNQVHAAWRRLKKFQRPHTFFERKSAPSPTITHTVATRFLRVARTATAAPVTTSNTVPAIRMVRESMRSVRMTAVSGPRMPPNE